MDEVRLRVLAEIGTNWYDTHNTPVEAMTICVKTAADAGATALKLQIGLDRLYSPARTPKLFKDMQKYKLSAKDVKETQALCHFAGLELWASVFDLESLRQCAEYLDGFKIASGDINNSVLVNAIGKLASRKLYNKPIAISTGAATYDEIKRMMEIESIWEAPEVILMQCNSEYPADPLNANLKSLLQFSEDVDALGYSDHTMTSESGLLALGLGFTVFEKHFTIPNHIHAPDNVVAMSGEKLKMYVRDLRRGIKIMGNSNQRPLTESEQKERIWARRGKDGCRPTDEAKVEKQ